VYTPIANIGGRTCFKYSKGAKPERQGQITSDTTFVTLHVDQTLSASSRLAHGTVADQLTIMPKG
jgi:hypothetical protein